MNDQKQIKDEIPSVADDRRCPQEDVQEKPTADPVDHSIIIPGQQLGSHWSRSSDGGTRANSVTEGETNELRQQQPSPEDGAPSSQGELEAVNDKARYDKGTQDVFTQELLVSKTCERPEERNAIVENSDNSGKEYNKQVNKFHVTLTNDIMYGNLHWM